MPNQSKKVLNKYQAIQMLQKLKMPPSIRHRQARQIARIACQKLAPKLQQGR